MTKAINGSRNEPFSKFFLRNFVLHWCQFFLQFRLVDLNFRLGWPLAKATEFGRDFGRVGGGRGGARRDWLQCHPHSRLAGRYDGNLCRHGVQTTMQVRQHKVKVHRRKTRLGKRLEGHLSRRYSKCTAPLTHSWREHSRAPSAPERQ